MNLEEETQTLSKLVYELAGKIDGLVQEIERLQMSETRLIAELGRIATQLEVEPHMLKVLGRIEQLKDAEWRLKDLDK